MTKPLLGDYKEGKAYSYFQSKWLSEVLYHPISKKSRYCFLKASCIPSQRIRNIPHQAWVLVEKNRCGAECMLFLLCRVSNLMFCTRWNRKTRALGQHRSPLRHVMIRKLGKIFLLSLNCDQDESQNLMLSKLSPDPYSNFCLKTFQAVVFA